MAAWSYSSLTAWETCPRRYKITRIDKTITEPQTDATRHGNEVHKALEVSVRDNMPLPAKYAAYEPIVKLVRASEGVKHTEHKFALTSRFTPVDYWAKDAWVRGVLDLRVVTPKTVVVLDWKGLSVDTPLPTPRGFTSMGAISVGDTVFDVDGAPCRVIGKSDVHHRPCFRVRFDDTSTVTCDDQHLWRLDSGDVVPVTALAVGASVPVCRPVVTEEARLPVDPYVLGLWLADGKHSSGEVSKPDPEVWSEVARRGYELGANTGRESCQTRTIKGIRGHLAALGVLRNKRIPAVYLRAGLAARVDLLRGLMDGDGSVNTARKQVIYTTCDKALSNDVKELALSLGQRVLQSRTTQRGFGKTVTAWPLSWRPQHGLNPFLLPRKAARVDSTWGPGQSGVRRVTSVEPLPSVPTQCIAVDSPTRTYLCTESFIPTHNTGKPKPDADQLKLFAAATFALHPHAEKVKTGYVWLGHNRVDEEHFHRGDEANVWREFLPRVQRMEQAVAKQDHPPRPSGLCRAWCPVPKRMCEFSGKE